MLRGERRFGTDEAYRLTRPICPERGDEVGPHEFEDIGVRTAELKTWAA